MQDLINALVTYLKSTGALAADATVDWERTSIVDQEYTRIYFTNGEQAEMTWAYPAHPIR